MGPGRCICLWVGRGGVWLWTQRVSASWSRGVHPLDTHTHTHTSCKHTHTLPGPQIHPSLDIPPPPVPPPYGQRAGSTHPTAMLSCSISINLSPPPFIITVHKQSCGNVMFLHLSVSHSVQRGESAPVHAGIHHSPGRHRHPLGRHPPSRQLLLRTVRTLLECIFFTECLLNNILLF